MKRLILILCLIFVLIGAPGTNGAVPLEDFEGQPKFELAENLVIPGVQINGNGFYYVTGLGPGVQPPANFSGQFLFAQDDIYGYGPLTLNFTQAQATASFGWALLGDDTMNVTGYLGGTQVLSVNFTGNACCLAGAFEGSAFVSGQFDTLVLDGANGTARQQVLDNLASTDYIPPPAASFDIPHISDIMITTAQAQPVYMDPAGQVVRINGGAELWLPHDYDKNGFDTYIVTSVSRLDGEVWVQIFLGSANFVWVPLSKVTPLAPIPGEE